MSTFNFSRGFQKFRMPEIKISDSFKSTAHIYFTYLYGGAIGLATFYGVKKGTEKWWHWKQERTYRKISIDYIESVVNIACDGGMWAYYILMCASSNAIVAATSPVSVPILLYFFAEPPKLENSKSTTSSTNSISFVESK